MATNSIDPRRRLQIRSEILASIRDIVESHFLDDPEAKALYLTAEEQAYEIGNFIINQIPYTDLSHISFPELPVLNNEGDLDPVGETPRVQRYGPLNRHWIGDPFAPAIDDDESNNQYLGIPVGFPVEFGQKRYSPEGFQQWRFHNGVKALRFTYVIYPGRDFEKEAHLTVFYSGGDH
jgi:hypothetical protein